MTWYFDPSGVTIDVYDHEETLVAQNTPIAFDGDGNPTGGWQGQYPNRVKSIAHGQMDGNQPSSYNQQVIADMACSQIEEGPPS